MINRAHVYTNTPPRSDPGQLVNYLFRMQLFLYSEYGVLIDVINLHEDTIYSSSESALYKSTDSLNGRTSTEQTWTFDIVLLTYYITQAIRCAIQML